MPEWCGVRRRACKLRGCWKMSRVAGSAIIYNSDFGVVMTRQPGDILCVLNTLLEVCEISKNAARPGAV